MTRWLPRRAPVVSAADGLTESEEALELGVTTPGTTLTSTLATAGGADAPFVVHASSTGLFNVQVALASAGSGTDAAAVGGAAGDGYRGVSARD